MARSQLVIAEYKEKAATAIGRAHDLQHENAEMAQRISALSAELSEAQRENTELRVQLAKAGPLFAFTALLAAHRAFWRQVWM